VVAGSVRVRTLYSGISAGTELTAYRGTNVYLDRTWDAARRLFVGDTGSAGYPMTTWGYSEVGEIVEAGSGVPPSLKPGVVVHGMWGHRSQAVVPAEDVGWRVIAPDTDPITGVFARVAAIALNAVLAAELRLGEVVAIFGQGVIGLLATRLATLSGARVVAVDGIDLRLAHASAMGATATFDVRDDVPVAERIRAHVGDVDAVIEISGSQDALREAIRVAPVGGRVVAAGFYQGAADGIRLGDEFHHNRVHLVASQIGGVPAPLAARWSVSRLHTAVDGLMRDGRLDVGGLVSHVLPAARAPEAFRLLDRGTDDVLQVVLDFRPGHEGRSSP
jgi:2-desacetyl-2-hydroxyethyl bacteriochlorophyllide A dehydrogenase